MRNLKRALSLAMASVMLLGLMVVGTGASYADVASKHNTEAIEVLQAVGIMTGDEKGNFNPDKNVTRNEMAVVMANMLELNVKDFTGSGNPFTDVPTWAQPYVTACYADGIVAGTSKTTYGGDATVTAVQAGLMVMKALGYFQYQEDFADDWQLATVKQASKIDLYDGINAGRTEALTRNEVAQLVLNALEADVVDFTGTVGTDIKTTDGTTIKVGYKSEYTAMTTSFNYNNATGVKQYVRQLCEQLYDNDLKKTSPNDVFGRPASQWKYKTEAVGTYAEKADATYANKVTKGTLYDLVGKDVVNKLTAAGVNGEYKLTVIVDGKTEAAPAVSSYFSSKSTGAAGTTGTTAVTGNGASTEVYIDDDNNVTIVIINTYVAQAASDYSTKNENLKIALPNSAVQPGTSLTSLTLDQDDFNVSDIKEDDYILYTASWVNGNVFEIQSIAPASLLTGTVDSYDEGNSVTIDGTKYSYMGNIAADTTNGKSVAYSTGNLATVVLDANGFVIYVDEAVADSGNWVYVSEVANASGVGKNFVADAFFVDGTNKTVNVKSWTTTGNVTYTTDLETAGGAHAISAGWYTYSTDSAGKYKLTAKTDAKVGQVLTSGDLIKNGDTTLMGGTGFSGIKANSATIFVVVDKDGDVTLYTGISNAPTVAAKAPGAQLFVVKNSSNSFAKFVFVDTTNATVTDATSSSSDFIYLMKQVGGVNVNSDGDKYYVYEALVNGASEKVNVDFDCTNQALFTLYYNAKKNSDGFITAMTTAETKTNVDSPIVITPSGANQSVQVDYAGGVLSFDADTGADKEFVLADKCTVYVVSQAAVLNVNDGANYELSVTSASALKTMLSGYKITEGSYYVERDDDATSPVVAVYVYVKSVVSTTLSSAKTFTATAAADGANTGVVAANVTSATTLDGTVVKVALTGAPTPANGDKIVVTYAATGTATGSGTVTLTYATATSSWTSAPANFTITAADSTSAVFTVQVV